MSISVKTPAPATLLENLKKVIYEGKTAAWLCDNVGDFTLTSDDFKNKAWLRPFERGDMLVFGIIGQKNVKMTKGTYAIFHAKFLEFMLINLDDGFISATISSAADKVDNFK